MEKEIFDNLEPYERFQIERFGDILPEQKIELNEDDRQTDFFTQAKFEVEEYRTYYEPEFYYND